MSLLAFSALSILVTFFYFFFGGSPSFSTVGGGLLFLLVDGGLLLSLVAVAVCVSEQPSSTESVNTLTSVELVPGVTSSPSLLGDSLVKGGIAGSKVALSTTCFGLATARFFMTLCISANHLKS